MSDTSEREVSPQCDLRDSLNEIDNLRAEVSAQGEALRIAWDALEFVGDYKALDDIAEALAAGEETE